jgi:hypothetical protein
MCVNFEGSQGLAVREFMQSELWGSEFKVGVLSIRGVLESVIGQLRHSKGVMLKMALGAEGSDLLPGSLEARRSPVGKG